MQFHGNYLQKDRQITFLHLHDCLEIGYCHEGAGIFVVEKKVMPFRAGDVSVINDGEMHLARSMEGTTSRWSWIYLDPERLIGDLARDERKFLRIEPLGGPDFTNLFAQKKHPYISHMVSLILRELEREERGYHSAVRGLTWSLMVRLHRIAGRGAKASSRKRDVAERIAPALEHVAYNFARTVRVEELAKLCHTSVTNLRRLFQRAVGMPPQDYLTHLRVQMGAALLTSTSRPVVDIAESVGYPSLSSFNRHFKRAMKMTPRDWRKRA